jgi:hypothetical protein
MSSGAGGPCGGGVIQPMAKAATAVATQSATLTPLLIARIQSSPEQIIGGNGSSRAIPSLRRILRRTE